MYKDVFKIQTAGCKFYKWGTTPGHRSAEIISKNGSGTSGSDGITSMTQYNNCSSTCLAP